MMLGGISKQQVRVPRSPSHGPVKGVTINTDASVHWCDKKLLKSDIMGHNLGLPSPTGSLKQAWFLSSPPYIMDYLQLPSLLFSVEDKGSRFL
jgi:hypothetical protein